MSNISEVTLYDTSPVANAAAQIAQQSTVTVMYFASVGATVLLWLALNYKQRLLDLANGPRDLVTSLL
jgi:hypothetical protein